MCNGVSKYPVFIPACVLDERVWLKLILVCKHNFFLRAPLAYWEHLLACPSWECWVAGRGETFLAADGEKRRILDTPSTSCQGCVILTLAQMFKNTESHWIHLNSCKLYLLYSCASTRNERKQEKGNLHCSCLCVGEILGSGTQMLCPIWKEDMGAILGICARSMRDLHCLYKALWGTAFPLKEGNPCVAHKWEVKMKTNFCKWHINGWTAHRKITNILRTKQRWTNIQGEKCVVHLRNAVLGSRNAKGFGIDVEIMQCSIAIKSANGALKWENESNLSRTGWYLFEIGVAVPGRHSKNTTQLLGRVWINQRNWKVCLKETQSSAPGIPKGKWSVSQFLNVLGRIGMIMGWKMSFQARWQSSSGMKLPEVEARSKTFWGFWPFWFSNNYTLELLPLAFLLQKIDF